MATNNPRGFIPVNHLTGDLDMKMTLRPTRGKNNAQIFPGDVVFLDASGAGKGIQKYHDAASAAAKPPLGVVGMVLNAQRRPYTFNQPGVGGPFIPTSSVGFAGVYEDPGIIYAANASATATFQHVGTFAQIQVTAPNTAAGRSGMAVDLGTTVSGAGQVLKVVNISPMDGQLEECPISGAANNDVEVVFVQHQWLNDTRRNEIQVLVSGNG